MALTRAQIAAAKDWEVQQVAVPEWGDFVYVRTLTAGDREKYESFMSGLKDKSGKLNLGTVRARLAALSLCDENGTRIYDDSQASIDELNGKAGSVIERIFDAARKHNNMAGDELEAIEQD